MYESISGKSVRQALEQRLGDLTAAAVECVTRAMSGDAATVLKAEQALREAVLKAGARAFEVAIEEADLGLRAALRSRGHRTPTGQVCHGRLRSKGVKPTTILTVLGETHPRRWTAECQECGRLLGTVEELFQTLVGMTPACANAVALAAVTVPYERARKSLSQRDGLAVDDNRVKRLVDALGPRASGCIHEMPGPSRRRLPPKGTRVYVLVDGGRIRLRANHGAWREPCLGLVMWQTPEGKWVKHCISHPTDKEKVLQVLDQWMQRLAPGEDGEGDWEVVIAGDGSEWIWNWATKHPWAIAILDYYHLKENVWKAARALHGDGTSEAAVWVREIMDILWRGQTWKVEMILDQLILSGRLKEDVMDALDRLGFYVRDRSNLIAYKKHRREGRNIGSGAIESLCKQVFTMRMKGPGMFWNEDGAENLMSLRTLYVTDQWESLWNQSLRNAS